MAERNCGGVPTRLQGILERLTAIRLHVGWVRRRLGRGEALDREAVGAHLDAVDAEVERAAAIVDDLRREGAQAST